MQDRGGMALTQAVSEPTRGTRKVLVELRELLTGRFALGQEGLLVIEGGEVQ